MRAGYLARWRGEDFEAFPAPTPEGLWVRLYADRPRDGFDFVREGRYRRVVLGAEVERIVYLRPVALWRGEPFLLRSDENGWAHLEYTGGDAATAARLGCAAGERGVYSVRARVSELTGVRSEAIELSLPT
ncbi:hypothetical protein [Cryptosporangium phraense]|uniref:hypothetical protein n=1 Tax=Cryptosporangium phraense TaxID=2593070 RepID=UPI00197AE93F|nr:hypothetical protein [Cryptosporangium phraense]